MKRKLFYIPIVLLILSCFACASLGINLNTDEKRYLAARTELNLLLEQYILIQDRITDNTHEGIKATFHAADLALDSWESGLSNSDYDPTSDIRTWLEAKKIIIDILRNY